MCLLQERWPGQKLHQMAGQARQERQRALSLEIHVYFRTLHSIREKDPDIFWTLGLHSPATVVLKGFLMSWVIYWKLYAKLQILKCFFWNIILLPPINFFFLRYVFISLTQCVCLYSVYLVQNFIFGHWLCIQKNYRRWNAVHCRPDFSEILAGYKNFGTCS